MTNKIGTKTEILTDYLKNLQEYYEWAQGDTAIAAKGLKLATETAQAALNGDVKLEGKAWYAALAANGLPKTSTKAKLAALEP